MKEIDFDKLELDEYEQDIVDNLENMKSVDNLEEEKERLQKIAQYSIEKKQLAKIIIKDRDLDNLIVTLKSEGISIADFLHNVFHKLATGAVDRKQFQY